MPNKRQHLVPIALTWIATLLLLSCSQRLTGGLDHAPRSRQPSESGNFTQAVPSIQGTALRLLSKREIQNSIHSGLGLQVDVAQFLTEATDGFDTHSQRRTISNAAVSAYQSLAEHTAKVFSESYLRQHAQLCANSPESCAKQALIDYGHVLYRRPLRSEESARYLNGIMATSPDSAVQALQRLLRLLLQSPNFLYRSELGQQIDVSEVATLSNIEIGTRLFFFVTGGPADAASLELIRDRDLSNGTVRREFSSTLLRTDAAKRNFYEFFAMWLGYKDLPHNAELSSLFHKETQALIEKLVFKENLPWVSLFTAPGTFVNPKLATHYGLAVPKGQDFSWVEYPDQGHRGMLSHGSFLSVGLSTNDIENTSIIDRGYRIRTRLLCDDIFFPENLDIDNDPADLLPGDLCKREARLATTLDPNRDCVGCHQLMDPIGFGFETFNHAGQRRSFEVNRQDCPIDSSGEIVGAGSFSDFSELVDLLTQLDSIDKCLKQRLTEFAFGTELSSAEKSLAYQIGGTFDQSRRFLDLVLDIIAHPSFTKRRVPS